MKITNILLIISIIISGLVWHYLSSPVSANNNTQPRSVYDGVSPPGPVMNPSPIPCLGGKTTLLIQDNVPWFAPLNQDSLGANVTELKAQNKNFCIINSNNIGTANLSQFSEIVLSAAQVQSFYDNLFPDGIVHSALTNYVQNGGIFSANLTDNASGPGAGGNWDGRTFVAGLIHVNDLSEQNNNIASPSHPIITGQFGGTNGGQIVDTANLQDLDGWNLSSHGFFTNIPPNATTILTDSLNRPVMIEYSFGTGRVIASQVTNEWRYAGNFGSLPQNKKLLANEIGYQDSLISTVRGQAANLAKELLNSAYLYGGKGWDYNVGEFVAPGAIKSGYNFWNQSLPTPKVDFGAGVDCSGLVMWSYNRAFDPTKSRFNNFVKAEGADEQFNENTESNPIAEAQLQPGDAMFFDFGKFDPLTNTYDGIKDGFIDHVVMFVGESGGFDMVSAANSAQGIVSVSKDVLKQLSGFVAFKRVVSSLPPKVLVTAGSPVDLVVTDPDGFTITPETIIPSDLEFLRQIPGVLYYSEIEQGADGRPIDQVYSYTTKIGDYLIKVLPEPDALSAETFNLSFTTDLATTTVLAENVPISEIPDQPYIIRVSEEGAEKIIPVKVKITPKTLNLGNKGVFSTIIEISKGFGVSVTDIDAETIIISGAFPVKSTVAAGKFLVATFRTQDLRNVQSGNEVELQISGNFDDGASFEGSDTIRIISQGRLSTAFGQFNQLASVLAALQSLLSQLLELLQP